MATRLTSVDLVNKCDGFPDAKREPQRYAEEIKRLYTLIWKDDEGPYPIGYVPVTVLEALRNAPDGIRGPMEVDDEARTILLFHEPTTEQERTKQAAQLTAYWRQSQTFLVLKGWRDEPFPIYGRKGELLFSLERVAVGLFGTMRYGVHMTAFLRRDDGKSRYDFRIWVPQRAANKSTYPSMLDNTVAGGMATHEDPFECVVREAEEEASLPEDFMRKNAKETGKITYIYITDERAGGEPGWIYPECQWVYDLELPADGSVTPCPKDGEVACFSLHTVEEIQEQLAQGLWKPNCAMIMVDFFVRHGILTPENEPYYDELRERARRFIPFPGPHWPHWKHASPPERLS